MTRFYKIDEVLEKPIHIIISNKGYGENYFKEQLATRYGIMLKPKKYKKKYHLRQEVIDSIIAILLFIGLLLIISGIEMLKF